MLKNKVLKFIIIFLLIITLFTVFAQNSFSLSTDISTQFQNHGDRSDATNRISTFLGKTINIFQVVGAGVAIIMLVVIGIKWVSASAMPSVKAEIAKTARYYILGAILIFSAIGILQIIKMFANTNVKDAV